MTSAVELGYPHGFLADECQQGILFSQLPAQPLRRRQGSAPSDESLIKKQGQGGIMGAQSYRVGVQLQPQHTSWAAYQTAVQELDRLGVDTIWNWDHFFPLSGAPDGAHFEGWTLLSAMAALTTRAEVGCLVTCSSYRNPALLAAMAKTVDHISGGRLILGLGAGWFERDYAEYGYHFGTAGERLRAMGAALPMIRDRWERDAPRPVRSIPVLIGGGGEKVTLKLTAQYADLWNGLGAPEVYARKNAVLTEWCRAVGRDPQAVERTVWVHAHSLAADPSLCDAYQEAGASHIIIGLEDPFPMDVVHTLLAWRDRPRASGHRAASGPPCTRT